MASECGRRSPGWAGKTATPISVSASTFRGHVGGVMLTSLDTYPVQKVDDVALAGAYHLRRDGRSGLLGFGLCLLGWVQARSCSPHNPLFVVFLVPSRKRRTITNVLSRAREGMYDFPKPRHTCVLRQGRSLAAYQINSGFPMLIHPIPSIAQMPAPQPSYQDGLDRCHHYLQ